MRAAGAVTAIDGGAAVSQAEFSKAVPKVEPEVTLSVTSAVWETVRTFSLPNDGDAIEISGSYLVAYDDAGTPRNGTLMFLGDKSQARNDGGVVTVSGFAFPTGNLVGGSIRLLPSGTDVEMQIQVGFTGDIKVIERSLETRQIVP